jgi:hypothetical protein
VKIAHKPLNKNMTKTFDQICKGILGEMVTTPTAPTLAPGQPQKPAPAPGQPATNQANVPAEVPDEIAKLFIAAKTPQEVNAAYAKMQQLNKTQPTQPAQQPNAATANQQA